MLTHASNTNRQCYGLGQCAKDLLVADYDYVDFLSRDGFVSEGTFYVTRKLQKLYVGANTSHKIKLKLNRKNKKKIVQMA